MPRSCDYSFDFIIIMAFKDAFGLFFFFFTLCVCFFHTIIFIHFVHLKKFCLLDNYFLKCHSVPVYRAIILQNDELYEQNYVSYVINKN